MSLRDTLAGLEGKQKHRALVTHAQTLVGTALGVAPHTIAENRPLQELGLDSVQAVDTVEKLGRDLGLQISGTVLFDHPTLDGLCKHLIERL